MPEPITAAQLKAQRGSRVTASSTPSFVKPSLNKSEDKEAYKPTFSSLGAFGKNVFQRPGAGIRSAIMGEGYWKGFDRPSTAPDIGNPIMDAIGRGSKSLPGPMKDLALGAGGVGAEFANQMTNPAEAIVNLLPGLKGARTLGAKSVESGIESGRNFFARRSFKQQSKGLVKDAVKSDEGMESFQKFVSGSFSDKYDDAYKMFGEGIKQVESLPNNLGKTIDASDVARSIQRADEVGDPIAGSIKQLVAQKPELAQLFDPELASKLSFREAQELRKALNSTRALQKVYAGKGGVTQEGLNLGALSKNLREKITSTFEGAEDLYAKYGSKIEDLDTLYPKLGNPTNVPGALAKGLKEKGTEFGGMTKAAFKRQMPELVDVAKRFKSKVAPGPFFKNPYVRAGATGLGYAAGGAGLTEVVRRVLK